MPLSVSAEEKNHKINWIISSNGNAGINTTSFEIVHSHVARTQSLAFISRYYACIKSSTPYIVGWKEQKRENRVETKQ